MSKWIIVPALTICMFAPGACLAADKLISFELGPQVEYFKYREPDVMKEHGGLFGGYFMFDGAVTPALRGRIFTSLCGGTLRYEGGTWDGEPLELNTPNLVFNLRPLLLYSFQTGALTVSPYSGLAVRFLYDNLSANYEGGYERQNTYIYSPIGLEADARAGEWTLGARGEFNLFWSGINHNVGIPIDSYHTEDVTLNQTSGYGLQGSLFARALISPTIALGIEPYVYYWDIGKSDSKIIHTYQGRMEIFEPSNNSLAFGLRCSAAW